MPGYEFATIEHPVSSATDAELLARARANGAAAQGTYVPGSEPSDDSSLFVANYSY